MIKNKDLTTQTFEQLNKLVNDKKNAFNLLADNFYGVGEDDIDSAKVVTRLQTQYFALSRNENNIKSLKDWDQNEFNEVSEVNTLIPEVLGNKYSSFALKALEEDFELNYPLDDDYVSEVDPFAYNDIKDVVFESALRNFETKLGVVVKQDDIVSSTVYKSNFAASAMAKIKNAFLKLCRKEVKAKRTFAGKISLQSKVLGYKVSNIEKLTKVLDSLLKVSVRKQLRAVKKESKQPITREMKFAARLFAGVLMSRVMDYSTVRNNAMVEKCLWLQYANVLNRYNFTKEQLKAITSLGAHSAIALCDEMGLTKEDIVGRMTKLGFIYGTVPTTKLAAFLNVREKDYKKYYQEDLFNEVTTNFVPAQKQEEPKEEEVAEEGIVVDDAEEEAILSDALLLEFSGKKGKKARRAAVEKIINNVVIKYVASQSSAIADKLNAGKYTGKKLEAASTESRLLSLLLTYYVQSANKRQMKIKDDGQYKEAEVARAKLFTIGLLNRKEKILELIENTPITRGERQSVSAYINKVCQDAFGYNLRGYIINSIKEGMEICLKIDLGKNAKEEDMQKYADPKLIEMKPLYLPEPPKYELIVDEEAAPKLDFSAYLDRAEKALDGVSTDEVKKEVKDEEVVEVKDEEVVVIDPEKENAEVITPETEPAKEQVKEETVVVSEPEVKEEAVEVKEEVKEQVKETTKTQTEVKVKVSTKNTKTKKNKLNITEEEYAEYFDVDALEGKEPSGNNNNGIEM